MLRTSLIWSSDRLVKMLSKKDFVYCAATGYLVLIMILIFSQDNQFSSVCSYHSPCVRFCCRNGITCNEKFIRENFKSGEFDKGGFAYDGDYKILFQMRKAADRRKIRLIFP